MKKMLILGAGVGVALVVAALLVAALMWPGQARAEAIRADIEPRAGIGSVEANMAARAVTLLQTRVVTQDTLGPAFKLMGFGVLDAQYVIAFSGTNATTITVRHSNDGVNWVVGTTLLAGGTSAGTSMTQVHNFGQWTAVHVDVSNSNPVTLSVMAVAR